MLSIFTIGHEEVPPTRTGTMAEEPMMPDGWLASGDRHIPNTYTYEKQTRHHEGLLRPDTKAQWLKCGGGGWIRGGVGGSAEGMSGLSGSAKEVDGFLV